MMMRDEKKRAVGGGTKMSLIKYFLFIPKKKRQEISIIHKYSKITIKIL